MIQTSCRRSLLRTVQRSAHSRPCCMGLIAHPLRNVTALLHTSSGSVEHASEKRFTRLPRGYPHHDIEQRLVRVPFASTLPAILALLQREADIARKADIPPKFIVYFPYETACRLATAIFAHKPPGSALGMPVWEYHRFLDDSVRTSTADAFRAAPSGVLFSTSIIDDKAGIPAVATVLQAGVPASVTQNEHRLHSVARHGGGVRGRALFVLARPEEFFVRHNAIAENAPRVDWSRLQLAMPRALVNGAMDTIGSDLKVQAYAGWLEYYKSRGAHRELKWTMPEFVRQANRYALKVLRYRAPVGAKSPLPPLTPQIVNHIGLKRQWRLLNISS